MARQIIQREVGKQNHCQVQFHFNFRLGDDERASVRVCVRTLYQQPQILNFQLFFAQISSRFFLLVLSFYSVFRYEKWWANIIRCCFFVVVPVCNLFGTLLHNGRDGPCWPEQGSIQLTQKWREKKIHWNKAFGVIIRNRPSKHWIFRYQTEHRIVLVVHAYLVISIMSDLTLHFFFVSHSLLFAKR